MIVMVLIYWETTTTQQHLGQVKHISRLDLSHEWTV